MTVGYFTILFSLLTFLSILDFSYPQQSQTTKAPPLNKKINVNDLTDEDIERISNQWEVIFKCLLFCNALISLAFHRIKMNLKMTQRILTS